MNLEKGELLTCEEKAMRNYNEAKRAFDEAKRDYNEAKEKGGDNG